MDAVGTDWWALLGPAVRLEPSGYLTTPHHAGRVLAKSHEVGALVLRPAERQVVEYSRLLDIGWKQSVFWPVVVQRRAAIDDWPRVAAVAACELHRICCLLSLEWNEPWQVLVSPEQTTALPPTMPDNSPPPNDWWDGWSPQLGLRDEVELRPWINEAWTELDCSGITSSGAAALSLWHEGILLQPAHPSFALVAFVACVEQVARVLPELQSIDKGRTAALYEAAVNLVATSNEIELMEKWRPYKLRSSTAHGSRVHGLETVFGAVIVPPFLADKPPGPVSEFVHLTVPCLSRVSRRQLFRLFGAEPTAA